MAGALRAASAIRAGLSPSCAAVHRSRRHRRLRSAPAWARLGSGSGVRTVAHGDRRSPSSAAAPCADVVAAPRRPTAAPSAPGRGHRRTRSRRHGEVAVRAGRCSRRPRCSRRSGRRRTRSGRATGAWTSPGPSASRCWRRAAAPSSFAGPVAGHGVVSVQHDDGLRTTYEPLVPSVRAGDVVARATCSAPSWRGTAAAPHPACTGVCGAIGWSTSIRSSCSARCGCACCPCPSRGRTREVGPVRRAPARRADRAAARRGGRAAGTRATPSRRAAGRSRRASGSPGSRAARPSGRARRARPPPR